MSKGSGSASRKQLEEFLSEIDVLGFDYSSLKYTSCYCEENIFKLCEEIKNRKPELLPNISVVLWEQKSGKTEEHVVIWDYHVVLIYTNEDESVIYDFDTLLPFPSPSDLYVLETFRPNVQLKEEYESQFRLIPAEDYLNNFQSDRSHMLKEDGITYISEPPSYPPITRGKNNLNSYISMESKDTSFGRVFSSYEFFETVFA